MKKYFLGLFLLIGLAILSSCGQSNLSDITQQFVGPQVSVDEIPDEPSKVTLIDDIKGTNANEIEVLLANNFYMLDVVQGDNGNANIYATRRFTIEELASVLTETIKPQQISDVKDNQQILIYPDHFVTLKSSEEDPDVLLIEVASDEFVRNNYSPNFLSTYFAIRLLDNVLGVNDWGKKRMNQCSNGGCYGGYSVGGSIPKRGMTDFRGGGPSAGK
ncbi:DUF4247 domain-containing protein [Aquibacillus salsiterrae]|uniref:DUF4247 domain-containing protein n=1 Tax=Aquibacillus salsiterrae TaxID=2950439 RepID=A0A9X4ADP4_9BACI|nr:DUF4247 domain-containing protein [Aquibacillus salsiterrae]MDC3415762.1 DUF4247 domain-containing protein [Aquibacillus salsiterrae]